MLQSVRLIVLNTLFLLFVPAISWSQDYIDLAELTYSFNPTSFSFIGDVQTIGVNLKAPIEFKNKDALITGLNGIVYDIHAPFGTQLRFYGFTVPLGYHKLISEKVILDFVTVTRLNSDLIRISKQHYQFGLASIFTIHYSESFKYKLGLYYNGEVFGPLVVPLLGFDWKINEKLRLFGMLPQDATILYRRNKRLALGITFKGQLASYKLSNKNYIQRTRNELAFFSDVYLTEKWVLQTKIGYLLGTFYKEYSHDEKIDLAVSVVKLGDNRVPLSKLNSNNPFFGINLIYRYVVNHSKETVRGTDK